MLPEPLARTLLPTCEMSMITEAGALAPIEIVTIATEATRWQNMVFVFTLFLYLVCLIWISSAKQRIRNPQGSVLATCCFHSL
jgi:cyanate permease